MSLPDRFTFVLFLVVLLLQASRRACMFACVFACLRVCVNFPLSESCSWRVFSLLLLDGLEVMVPEMAKHSSTIDEMIRLGYLLGRSLFFCICSRGVFLSGRCLVVAEVILVVWVGWGVFHRCNAWG